MIIDYDISMACRQGPRELIEDNAFGLKLDHPFNDGNSVMIFGVLDGVGGHAGGHIASAIGTTSLTSSLATSLVSRCASSANGPLDGAWNGLDEEHLAAAFTIANDEILCVARTNASLSNMASTAVCGVVTGNRLVLGWAGDSRAYRLRRGNLTQLTRDHSQVQGLIDRGLITATEAEHHPDRHVITNHLGCRGCFAPEILVSMLQDGDRLLLCTDGVHDVLVGDALTRLLNSRDFDGLADVIVDQAIRAATTDNATALCIRVRARCLPTHQSVHTLVGDYAQNLADIVHRHQLQEIQT